MTYQKMNVPKKHITFKIISEVAYVAMLIVSVAICFAAAVLVLFSEEM